MQSCMINNFFCVNFTVSMSFLFSQICEFIFLSRFFLMYNIICNFLYVISGSSERHFQFLYIIFPVLTKFKWQSSSSMKNVCFWSCRNQLFQPCKKKNNCFDSFVLQTTLCITAGVELSCEEGFQIIRKRIVMKFAYRLHSTKS